MAFLMKQQAVYFILFGGLALLVILLGRKNQLLILLKKLSYYAAGVFIPYLLLLFIVWTWVISAISRYGLFNITSNLLQKLPLVGSYLLFYIFLSSLLAKVLAYMDIGFCRAIILIIKVKFHRNRKIFGYSKETRSIFLLGSVGNIMLRLLFPGALLYCCTACCSAYGCYSYRLYCRQTDKGFQCRIMHVIISGCIPGSYSCCPVVLEQGILFLLGAAACRIIYNDNPFPEAVQIAKYIKANSNDSDKIAVFGSEPEICFYADRQSEAPQARRI